MIKLILMLMMGCAADLKTSNDADSLGPPPEPPVMGINERDDCDQKNVGSSVCNFVLLDQNGEFWELYDYTGKVVILDFSTAWCYPCQIAGNYTQAIQDEYDDDIVFVTLLIEGVSGLPSTEADVNEWVASHNITTAPVLRASREYVMDPQGVTGYLVGGYPTYVYIDQEMIIQAGHSGFNIDYVKNIIDGLL